MTDNNASTSTNGDRRASGSSPSVHHHPPATTAAPLYSSITTPPSSSGARPFSSLAPNNNVSDQHDDASTRQSIGKPLSEVPSKADVTNYALQATEGYASRTYREAEDELLKHADTTLEEVAGDMWRKVSALLDEDWDGEGEACALMRRVQEQTKVSMGVLEEALRRYSLEALSLSYNGGKDCLVLLVLYLAAIYKHFKSPPTANTSDNPLSTNQGARSAPDTTNRRPSGSTTTSIFPPSLNSIYILPPSPFPAVDAFVRSSTVHYHLSLASSTLPMKAAFQEYLERNPHIDAIFVGTRRTDPHGERLGHFDRTDRGWPDFMRVHPVIDWRYQEVWAFIRHLRIPYCPLYDLGYTSLGGTDDTNPNPALRDPGDPAKFRPAWALLDDLEERLGRERSKSGVKDGGDDGGDGGGTKQ